MSILERERERESKRGRSRDRRQRIRSRLHLSAQSPMWGLNPQTLRSWPDLKLYAQPTEPPRCPSFSYQCILYNKRFSFLNYNLGAPEWLRRLSIRLSLRSWSRGSWVRNPRWALGWQPKDWSLLQTLCLPLSAPTLLALCLSHCLKNK